MKAFVTGSTGLLGNNLVRHLIAEGHEVVALARSRKKAATTFDGLPVTVVEGDLSNVAAFAPHLAGCDVLFNTAAYFREYYGVAGDHWKMLEVLNITATVQLFAEAQKRGVQRVIHTSSSGVIGASQDGRPGDETIPPDDATMQNLYFRSKVLGDKAIAEFQRTSGLPIVTILPTWMFGPGDAAPTAAGQFVLDFLNRKLPGTPDGGTSIVDARDVAAGMILAATKGRSGEKYVLGGRYADMTEVAKILATVSGVPAPKMVVSYPLAMAFATVSELLGRLTGKPAMIPREGVRLMRQRANISSAKAERELGATFRPLEATLTDVVAWYRQRDSAPAPNALSASSAQG